LLPPFLLLFLLPLLLLLLWLWLWSPPPPHHSPHDTRLPTIPLDLPRPQRNMLGSDGARRACDSGQVDEQVGEAHPGFLFFSQLLLQFFFPPYFFIYM
jgi:hypothetical protein